jgi:hypothetical protein
MRRLSRWFLVVVSLSIVSLVAAGLVSVAWNDHAEDICREEGKSGYTVNWDWAEFAYVCDYRAPNQETRRIGIIEAFHGEGRQRHRPGR